MDCNANWTSQDLPMIMQQLYCLMENIVEIVKDGLQHGKEAQRAGTALAIVNMAVMQGDAEHTFQTLEHDDLNLQVQVQNDMTSKSRYQDEFAILAKAKQKESSPWVVQR